MTATSKATDCESGSHQGELSPITHTQKKRFPGDYQEQELKEDIIWLAGVDGSVVVRKQL